MRSRGLVARATILGAVGGMAAGAFDFVRAASSIGTFLPSGKIKLLGFLVGLYGGTAALLAAASLLILSLFARATDVAALWDMAFHRDGDHPREGRRFGAYLTSLLGAGTLLGFLVRNVALQVLTLFHHRLLIAALVGASAAGLFIVAAALVFVGAAILSPILPIGPRLRLHFRAPAGLLVLGWVFGLGVGALSVGALLFELEKRKMVPALKALNTGIWAPGFLFLSVVVGHSAIRVLFRLLPTSVRENLMRRLGTVGGATLMLLGMLALPLLLFGILNLALVRQLDLRPWWAIAVAIAVSAIAAFVPTRSGSRLRSALTVVLAPLLLFALAFHFGDIDRVRKSALAFTGVTPPLVTAIHALTDLDHDGYSSVLGGGDCNDFDPDVHPDGVDWPDNGLDENCNGHQATLKENTPRPFATVPSSVPEAPNVILITVDAVRADHVGAYGYSRPTTPNLDAFAREAVLFKNAWAHAPSTRYSVPAILTGRYPSTIPVGNAHWPPNVLPENRLIAEILKERAGYHTAAFLSYHYFERAWGLDQGFDTYDTHLETLHSMGGDPSLTHGSSARELADEDIDFLRAHAGEKFFLWSHFYDTHYFFEKHTEPETQFGSEEIDLYDGEIRYTDTQLGRFFAALKELGLWEKTIIIVTSDHGDGFGEHGIQKNQRHGYHLYRTETKVPILIRVPGIAPRAVDEPVGHIDLLPTVLNALRRPESEEPQLLGASLLGLMQGFPRVGPPRRIYQEVWYEGPTSRRAIADVNWHYLHNIIPDDTHELYDLTADPAEDHDQAGNGEPIEDELKRALGAVVDQIALPADFADKVAGNVSDKSLSPSKPLGDDLGGYVRLEGVDLVTPSVAQGGQAEIRLYLQGEKRLPPGWHLFTHLVGKVARINADHEPLEGLYPIARLKPGVFLRDRVRVPIPSTFGIGPVQVEVGLWRRGERMPTKGAHSGADVIHAATLMVTPHL